ncbi:MAG: phosphatase PAP2 family protein [Gemmatimonadota bacterium]
MPARSPIVRSRLLAVTAAAFFVVAALGRLAGSALLTGWDGRVIERLALHRDSTVTGWMDALSFIGGGWIAIPVGLLVSLWLYRRGDRQAALCYAATGLSGWALSILLKIGFQRLRPNLVERLAGAGGFSYPSGHAMLAPLVFGLGVVLLVRGAPRWISGPAVAGALALSVGIALSRVYLAVHYPTDVIGALLAGSAWAALGVAVWSPLDPHPTRVPGSPAR